MSVLDVIRARRERAATSAPVANVATRCNGFATPCNTPKPLINNDLLGRVANVASVAQKNDEVGREAQTPPMPSMREAHEAYLAHHWRCPTCCAAGQGYGQRCAEGARLWGVYYETAQRERAEREAAKRQRPAPAPTVPPEFCDHRDPATDAEIARMAARTEAFQRAGLTPDEADWAAERLLRRDRDRDDRRLCLECAWLRADATGWRCGALRGPIPSAWVTTQLQRCHMFKESSRD